MSLGEAYPQAGLVGLWHLNGNATDTSGLNCETVVENNITYLQANGKFGLGAGFNGTNSRLNIRPGSFYSTNNTAWSYAGWFKTSTSSTNSLVVIGDYDGGSGADATFSCMVRKDPNHNLVMGIRYNNTDYLVTSTQTVNDGKWHFFALTASKTTGLLRCYLDGNQVGSDVSINTGVNYFDSLDFFVGTQIYSSAYTAWWDGAIDDLSMWSKALSAQEIRRMFAVGTGKLQ